MALTEYLDPSGWFFEWENANGLILKNVRHAHFRCANDLRIAGMWVGSHDPTDAGRPKDAILKQISLRPPDFQQTDLTPPTDPRSRVLGSIQGFSGYQTAAAIGASYLSKDAILGAGTNSEFLHLTQRFVLTRYGMNPAHEPGAVLPAARLFPLLGFRFIPLSADSKPVRYFRVDYRLHFNLDSFGFDDPRARIEKIAASKISSAANQVGIFRDSETTPAPIKLVHVGPGPNDAIPGPPDIGDVFAAAEKPLQYEILTRGLTRGKSQFMGRPGTWDNFHQWPADYPGGLPSTPGAFHCMHLHWRWATIAGIESTKLLDATKLLLPAGGQPQFTGIGGAGGPLLDPKIPDQSIRFAITTNFNTNLATDVLSTEKFDDLFLKRKETAPGRVPGTPDEVKKGADLVLWFSIEVFRGSEPVNVQSPWEGTLFMHGCYFAHDPEPGLLSKPGFISASGGTRSGLLKPIPTRTWARLAG